MDKRSKAQLDVRPVGEGVTRMTFAGDDVDLTWTMTEPAREHVRAARPFEQVLYMVSGRMRLTVGDEQTTMDAAEMVVIPPHTVASSTTLDEAAVDLLIGRPAGA